MFVELAYEKVRDVKSPNRAHPEDAGIDFFCPKLSFAVLIEKNLHNTGWHFDEVEKRIRLDSLGRILIPSGIKVQFSPGFALLSYDKSGVSHKKGLLTNSGVVDSNYSGEVHINMFNLSQTTQYINENDKIVQFLLMPISIGRIVEKEKVHLIDTDRGSNGFGSTDTDGADKEKNG